MAKACLAESMSSSGFITQTTAQTHSAPVSAPPTAGTRLPDFTLKLATKDGPQDFNFNQNLGSGPMVFAFFPLAFSGICTKELCDMRDNLAQFEGALKVAKFRRQFRAGLVALLGRFGEGLIENALKVGREL